MGVHGLWELLAPVGRRVSVETLAGKKLAIDASIWMIQFMKAMRDEKGEMIRNAHILGFFRRICKLLFLRTKPVFVFDGGTPALKRRTVIARRRQRENAQAKIRKTAEKLLLNHLKAIRLKELAEDLEKQRKENDVKGKKPIIEEPNNVQQTEKGNDDVGINYNQEELDAMLAASLAAEEKEGFTVDASTSGAAEATNDEDFVEDDEDEDEEMILPEMHGKVDPAVLAALPPSMQLDLLVQMRERLMAENRQKYQKVKKAPERFSELQIQSYLKTVAFRREIDGVQKAAAGRGIGGMQTSRIASEANREFIFSSSFTGDKQAFTSVGLEKVQAEQSQPPPVSEVLFTQKSSAAGPAVAEAGKQFHDDVETYMDERGRVRVSRVRALGIRMTRDLQRNLDLMKEIDQEKVEKNQGKDNESTSQHGEITDKGSNGMNDEVVNGTSIEISFDDTLENEEDELFASLVAGDNYAMEKAKQSSHSESDCEWEEGVIENRSTPNVFEGDINDEREVQWEEGFQDSQLKSSICPDESMKAVRKGNLEEEADFQEAIRRSLEVIEDKNTSNTFEKGINDEREVEWEEEFQDIQMKSSTCPDESVKTIRKGNMEEEADFQEAIRRSLEVIEDKNTSNKFEKGINDEREVEWEEGIQDIQMNSVCPDESMITGGKGNLEEEADFQEGIRRSIEENDFHEDQVSEIDKEMVKDDADLVPVDEEKEGTESNFSEAKSETFVESKPDDSNLGDNPSCYAEVGKISANDFTTNVDSAKELAEEETFSNPLTENEEVTINSSINYDNNEQDMMKDYLEEEMLNLGKEREELGSEQRKQERNAESVSSEMFAECQELLQMFGLPYIIAPMEAEAQCAFMELSNLVDGVVTDDSDAFLFGARSVFKNIFDDRKYVETYLMKDIEDELGLDREKLIHMAMLLGSDYTEGISGIGIVNAIEVVNAFPEKDGLHEFREWIESPDPSILGVHPKQKGSDDSENLPVDDVKRIKEIFMDKHRNVSKNWHIPSTFPSDAVISAYASPQVDKSTEPFGWGKPDLFILRKLCWEKFGWNTSKTDELLVPVLKEYNKHETQLRLEAFYTFNERFAKVRSKRINKALKGITGQKSSEKTPGNSESGKKRKVKVSQDEVNLSGVDSTAGNGIQNSNTKKQKISKRNVEKSVKNRGRGRGQVSAKGRKKKESSSEDSKSDEEEMETVGSQETCRVRRSDRVRKTVNYNVSEEFDNCDKQSENYLKEDETTTELSFDQTAGGHLKLDENELNKSIPSMDTTSPSEIDGSKIEDHANLSNDYLQFGGGFCVDEDEGKEGDKLQPSPTRGKIPDESDDPNRMSGISPKPSNGGDFPDMELSMNLDDTEENDAPKSYLRAMPNLRRKRRKN